jgi:hypothetical protein
MKKNVAAIRKAVRAWGLICASINLVIALFLSQVSKPIHLRKT